MTTPNDKIITLTEDEGKALRESIRAEEKAKLSTRIHALETMEVEHQNLKSRFVALENENAGLTQQIGQLNKDVDDLRKAVPQDGKKVDIQKIIEEVRQATIAQVSQGTTQQINELTAKLTRMESESAQLRLENYRAKRLAEEQAKGSKFIAELVNGNSEVEIEQSITKAQEVYSRHFPSGAVTAPPTTVVPAAGASASGAKGPTPVATPAVGDAAAHTPAGESGRSIQEVLRDVRAKGDPKAYAEQRRDLKAAAKEEFSNTVGANLMTR